MSSTSGEGISVSFSELEAFHDVLEAARCYWHKTLPSFRAAETLRTANHLFWTIGEYLPKTGEPSDRFQPVSWSSNGNSVERLIGAVQELTREYTEKHDPWWADTIVVADNFAKMLSPPQWRTFLASLTRLGLTLDIDTDFAPNRIVAERRDIGPWPEQS